MTGPGPRTPTDPRTGALTYVPQLESLRALALGAVLLGHYRVLDGLPLFERWGFQAPTAGLDALYVMSAFLITTLLLNGRRLVEAGGQSVGFTLARFHARRVLRIFPAYYATLLVLLLLGEPSTRAAAPWHLTYTTNLYIASREVILYPTLHFWSLAVEQQFYLAWPLLIFLVPRRRLPDVIFVLCAVAVTSRAVFWLQDQNLVVIRFLTTSILDLLGLGALLAIYRDDPERHGAALRRLLGLARRVGVPAALLCYGLSPWYDRNAYAAFSGLANALFFVWLIDRTLRGWGGPFGRLLDLRAVRWIGRVSYTAYLVHLPVEWFVLARLHWGFVADDPVVRFFLLTGISLAIAGLSWRLLERPLNDLKRHVPYRRQLRAEAPA